MFPLFNGNGIGTSISLMEADRKVTKAQLEKAMKMVDKEGTKQGFKQHEIVNSDHYANPKDKRAVPQIEEAVLDAGKDAALEPWEFASYLDSTIVIADMDAFAAEILNLQTSGEKLHLKEKADVYQKAYVFFKKRMEHFVSKMSQRQKDYLRVFWGKYLGESTIYMRVDL